MDNELVTDQAKLNCAKRELAMRKRVYPRWISQGRMTAQDAQHEIAAMQAILDDYERKVRPKMF